MNTVRQLVEGYVFYTAGKQLCLIRIYYIPLYAIVNQKRMIMMVKFI